MDADMELGLTLSNEIRFKMKVNVRDQLERNVLAHLPAVLINAIEDSIQDDPKALGPHINRQAYLDGH